MTPYLKFIAPALATIALTLVTAIEKGHLDGPAFEIGFVGLVASTVSFIVTNGSTGVKRYMKALAPAVLGLAAVAGHYLVTGDWNDHDTRAAVVVGCTSIITLLVPNAKVSPTPLR